MKGFRAVISSCADDRGILSEMLEIADLAKPTA